MDDEQQALENFTRQLNDAGGATEDMVNSLKDAEKGLAKHTKKIGMDLAKGIGSMTGSVLNGSKGFDSLIPVIDGLGSAMAGLAGSLPLVGKAAAQVVEGATEASKFLIGELGKQVQTFNDVSKAGLLATDGMTGFSKSAFSSMLTLEQFGRIVTDNSQALAAMSGSAYDGAAMFGNVTSDLANRDDLRLLGLNAEEIAEVTAEFTKQQTRLGRTQGMTAQQLAGSTAGYIKELDVLAKLTGENRKDLQARRAALLQETRYSAMVAGMKEEEAEAVTAAVSMIGARSERFATGMKDILTSGTATTEEGRQLMLLSGGAARDIGEQLKTGAIDQVQAVNMLKEAIGPNLERFRGLSQILGDSNEVTAGYSDSLKFVTTQTKDLAEMYKTQKTQMEGYDPSDDGLTISMAQAQKDIEEFAANANKIVLELMPTTAKVTDQLTTILLDLSKFAKDGLENSTDAPGGVWNKFMSFFGMGRTKEQMNAGKMTNGGVGVSDEDKKAYLEKRAEAKERLKEYPHFAKGGITDFSNAGELAVLHGTEAVVPLPDGKTIPVSVDTEQIAKALQPTSMPTSMATSMPLSVNTEEMSNLFNTYTAGQKDLMAAGGEEISNLFKTYTAGMKDILTSGTATTDEARRLLLSEPQRVAGASRSTLPSSINADQLVPAVATAVNEVQSQTKPSESANTELLETLNRQVADLVRLSSRQLNVSQQTRSQLM